MNKGSKCIARPLASPILPLCVGVHVPPVMRDAERITAPGLARRYSKQRLKVRIATDHSIERHQVRGSQLGSQREEVAVPELDPGPVTSPKGFAPSRFDVRGCGFHMNGALQPAFQQLVLQHPDASSHIQKGFGDDTESLHGLQQVPRGSGRPSTAIIRQFLLRPGPGEMPMGGLAMTGC